jgi:hypothetical protein
VKIALLFFAHGKAGAIAHSKIGALAGGPLRNPAREKGQVHQLAAIQDTVERALDNFDPAFTISNLLEQVAATPVPEAPKMSPEAIRLFLQAYNAGPYALLKYKGNVPYRETQDYAPRVMKYYKMDLSNSPFEPYILQTAKKYDFDPQLIRAIIKTESDFDLDCVSHAGARGLMQVMPVVWKDIKARYKFEWNYSTDVFDPAKNIEVSCAYLAWLRYDFLPKHFAAFESNPPAPPALIRDNNLHSSEVRIVASATPVKLDDISHAKSSIKEKSDSADEDESSKSEKGSSSKRDSDKAKKADKIEITVSESEKSKKDSKSSKKSSHKRAATSNDDEPNQKKIASSKAHSKKLIASARKDADDSKSSKDDKRVASKSKTSKLGKSS